MPKLFSSTCEEAVLVFDKTINGGRAADVYDCMSEGKNSYYTRRQKMHFDRMGIDIFRRSKNVFIEKSAKDGLDTEEILLTRKAIMIDETECQETFLTKKTDEGWQVAERKRINLKRQLTLKNSNPVVSYDGYNWNVHQFAPWMHSSVKFTMSADERGPTVKQIDALNRIIGHKESFLDEIGESTLSYVKYVLDEWLGDGWTELSDLELGKELGDITLKKPTTPAEALQTILPPYEVAIDEDQHLDESIGFRLYVQNKIDPEHGLGFLIKDWKIVEKGEQGSI